jgi:hypothetical protein
MSPSKIDYKKVQRALILARATSPLSRAADAGVPNGIHEVGASKDHGATTEPRGLRSQFIRIQHFRGYAVGTRHTKRV